MRHSFKINGGFREGGSFLEAGNFTVQYNHYTHSEIDAETGEVGTSFKNNTLVYNGLLDQKRRVDLAADLVSGSSIVTLKHR